MWGLFRARRGAGGQPRVRATGSATTCRRSRSSTLNEAMLLTYCGRPLDALAVARSRARHRPIRAPAALRALAEVPALVATGRCATAVDEARPCLRRADRSCPNRSPSRARACTSSPRSTPLAECGRLADAAALATAAYEATPPTAPPDALMWLSHQLGRCALLPRTGRDGPALARRGAGPMRRARHRRSEPAGAVGCSRPPTPAWATPRPRRHAVDELDRRPAFPFARPEQELGRAWALVAAGDLPGAREVLRDRGRPGGDRRLPHHRGVAPPRRRPARRRRRRSSIASPSSRSTCEGDLVAAYAGHAAAVGRRPARMRSSR